MTTPTVITAFNDLLQDIQANPSGSFVLGADIDASGFNFTPIANFSGVLDGQGHSISNLPITLLGTIDSQGTVENLTLTNVNVVNSALAFENDGQIVNVSVSGTVTGNGATAALVYINAGSIELSHSTATVRSGSGGDVAGFVGVNTSTGSISNSYAAGPVIGNFNGSFITQEGGGLVAENRGLISGCYATGSVSGVNNHAGGLVALNQGTITNSYATGSVSSEHSVGGLVGSNYTGTVTDSYATGFVETPDPGSVAGGLVGFAFQGTVANSYWDSDTSGTSNSAGGTARTTAQLQSGTLPDGFDSAVWFDNSGQFPELLWQVPANQPPVIDLTHSTVAGTINELAGVTGSSTVDYANGGSATLPSGVIAFSDPDVNDRPTASIDTVHETVTWQDTAGHNFQLSAAQTAMFEDAFHFSSEMGNTSTGKIDWIYSIADKSLDFLGVGESVTVTTPVIIDDGHRGTVTQNVVVTINGANDVSVSLPDFATVQTGQTLTADSAHGVLANYGDPDMHDTLHVSAVNGLSSSVGTAIHGAHGTLTLNANGSYTYKALPGEAKSGQDLFAYTVDDGHGGVSTSELVFTVQATRVGATGSAGLNTAANIFHHYGTDGEMVVLASLSDAAYHLVPNVEQIGAGINLPDGTGLADSLYNSMPTGMRYLTAADLPSLAPRSVPGNPDFPSFGLIDGMYLDGNAAALVARSSDSLFISFRGTNDSANFFQNLVGGLSHLGGTPDTNDYTVDGMNNYYALLKPLVLAIDGYLSANRDIGHVYVTGHSLGASMVQLFMNDAIVDKHAGVAFQAVTFADPGYGFSHFSDDPRITNILIAEDPIEQSPFALQGDVYQVVDYDFYSGGGSLHDMGLYYKAATFFNSQNDSIPQPSFGTDNTTDGINLYANIIHSDNPIDPWQVTLPTGSVPSSQVFQLIPRFDIYQNETMGVTHGGTLTGGPGHDTFTFSPQFGRVTINNFNPATDIIQVDHSLFGNAHAILANALDDGHGNTVITYDATDTITLAHVTKAALHLSDFHIV